MVHDSSADSLRLHLLRLANDLVRSTLDDTARLRKLSADTHEVGIDIASSLATLVDAPVVVLARVLNENVCN